MIQAYAGTAKTTTIALAAPGIRVPALALAFNRRIATELKSRLPSNWQVKTMNGLGHLAWIRGLSSKISSEIDDRKLSKVVRQVAKDGRAELSKDQFDQLRSLVALAMQRGLSPFDEGSPLVSDSPETWADLAIDIGVTELDRSLMTDLARASLISSIALAKQGILSFDDQIYCPTILGDRWPKYPAIAVDEAQDLSPLNHRMVTLVSRDDAKMLVVGDPKQAIYAWRGADSASMNSLRELRPSGAWADHKLTMTFRCPKSIVERQSRHAPGFRAFEKNRQGRIATFVSRDPEQSLGGWSFQSLRDLASQGDAKIAVLCRNNAPILSLALALLRQRVAPVVIGRDIGRGLIALARTISREPTTPIEIFLGKLDEWEAGEKANALAQSREDRLESIEDRSAALRAVATSSDTRDLAGLVEILSMLFRRETGDVELSTIHRAKGLEWDVVVHLDPWRIPSKQAKQASREGDDRQYEQEMNLLYVCETRTRDVLVNARLEDFIGAERRDASRGER